MDQNIAKTIYEKVKSLSEDDQKELLEMIDKKEADASASKPKTFLERMIEISDSVPDEEWAKLPSDGSANHDHYLYGAPKRY